MYSISTGQAGVDQEFRMRSLKVHPLCIEGTLRSAVVTPLIGIALLGQSGTQVLFDNVRLVARKM